MTRSIDDLAQRVLQVRHERDRRVIIGVVGEPGAGKSTVAEAVCQAVRRAGVPAALVPMDGFHLANVALAELGLTERKGAIETFDAWGYVALLRRLHRPSVGEVIYAPTYDRSIEESVASAVVVPADTEIVITEGNYLLADADPWSKVRGLLDETWFLTLDPDLRRDRLVARHIAFGKESEQARSWVASVDENNAAFVRECASRADLVIDLQ